MGLADRPTDLDRRVEHGVGAGDRDAEDVLDLGGDDDDRRGGGEPDQHRVREEVDHEREAADLQHQVHQADECGERRGAGEIGLGALLVEPGQRRAGHQRDDRDGTDGELARGAEHRVHEHRHDRGVQAHLWGQAGEQGVREALGDQ